MCCKSSVQIAWILPSFGAHNTFTISGCFSKEILFPVKPLERAFILLPTWSTRTNSRPESKKNFLHHLRVFGQTNKTLSAGQQCPHHLCITVDNSCFVMVSWCEVMVTDLQNSSYQPLSVVFCSSLLAML